MAEHIEKSHEETTEELFRRFLLNRDSFIRHRIIEMNLGLVKPVVRKYRSNAVLCQDLLQVGYVGLIKAVDLYNPERNTKFSTCATHWIEGEIRHFLRDKADIARKPRWFSEVMGKAGRFVERYVQEHDAEPSEKEISKELNITEEGVREILKARAAFSGSLEIDGQEIDVDKIRSSSPESFRLPIEDRIMIEQALERLKKVERKVVYMVFYFDLTQVQIAGIMGVPQRKVSRLLQKGIRALKGFLQR